MIKEDGKLGRMMALLDIPAGDRLRLYLDSPACNRSKPVRMLAEDYLNSAKHRAPNEHALFSKIYPTEDFDPIKLKNIRAALQRKLDDFLAFEAFVADEHLQNRLLLRQLNVLNESHYFPKYHQKTLEGMREGMLEEEQRHLALVAIAEEAAIARIRLTDRSQGEDNNTPYHHAWQYFQLHTVRFLVRQANLGAIEGQAADTMQAEKILDFMQIDDQAMPTLRLYRQLLDVFRDSTNHIHLQKLRTLLIELAPRIAAADASDIYTGAINHCIRRINKGEADYASEMLALYQEMDARNLLLLHGRLLVSQFKNMVGLALRFSAFEWAEVVIDRYASRLDQDPHGNAASFNHGMLEFAKGNFGAAERFFNEVLQDFDDVFFGLDARIFLLRIHYETENWLGLESLAESFKMYLKRNKRVPKAHRDSYLRSAMFFAKLARAVNGSRKGLLKLRNDVAQATLAATGKQWLLQKIEARIAASID